MRPKLFNAAGHGEMIRHTLEQFRGMTIDEDVFEEMVYKLALSAYSYSVYEDHRNASPLDID